MSAQVENWRVNTADGIFETDLETLKQWIVERRILPTDKVSKGKLNWIEAGRAPILRAAFSGDATVSAPVSVAVVSQSIPSESEPAEHPSLHPEIDRAVTPAAVAASTNACHNHPDAAPAYVCRVCATPFCADCPKFVGASRVPLCPLCGDLCREFHKERAKFVSQQFQGSGFGFADFGRALRYPLQHKVALLCGAALYGFLLLAGFRGRIVAFVIMFGCISHVISQVTWGRLDRSFMPDLSAFSLWDDVAVPIGLGIGITIVTWGPMIVLVLTLIFGLVNGPRLSPFGAAPPTSAEQSRLSPEDLKTLSDPEADPKKLEAANSKLNQLRPGHEISEEAERSRKEQSDPLAVVKFMMSHLQVSLVLAVLVLLSMVWGVFYYPMALAVAGYTEHFSSVINPMVGLDTIRRMRGTYFKAFGMVILIQIVGLIVSVIVGIVTSPFTLPFFGNLPATFIDGTMTFYFNLVIACVLGLALHKCGDRLGINTTA